MFDCVMCDRYFVNRLPDVMRMHFDATGEKTDVALFMAGVHRRHLANLPIFPNAVTA